jgi:hypothetical protein
MERSLARGDAESMTSSKQHVVRAVLAAGVMTLGACGDDGVATAPDSAQVDATVADAAEPDAGPQCQAGYQDDDGDGTCKLSCAGTGANDGLNCGAGGTCEIDDAGDRGCSCNEGYEGVFCDTCSLGYEKVGDECVLDLPPTTNLALWLDADSATSLAVTADHVASWADRRGGGAAITLAQSAVGARPGYQPMGQASRGAVVFDGDDQLFVNGFAGLSGDDYEIIIALNPVGEAAKGVVSLASGTSSWAVMVEQPAGDGDYVATHRNPPGTTGGIAVTADRTTGVHPGWVVATHQASGAADSLAVFASDGSATTQGITLVTSSGIDSSLTFRVGRSQAGFMAGQIFEVLVYTQRLTVAERERVTDYLTTKWHL